MKGKSIKTFVGMEDLETVLAVKEKAMASRNRGSCEGKSGGSLRTRSEKPAWGGEGSGATGKGFGDRHSTRVNGGKMITRPLTDPLKELGEIALNRRN